MDETEHEAISEKLRDESADMGDDKKEAILNDLRKECADMDEAEREAILKELRGDDPNAWERAVGSVPNPDLTIRIPDDPTDEQLRNVRGAVERIQTGTGVTQEQRETAFDCYE